MTVFRSTSHSPPPLRLRVRRWVALVAAFAVGALLTLHFAHDGGVYSSRTSVVFTFPGAKTIAPYNGSDFTTIIGFAQTIAMRANGGLADPRYYSSSNAPLYGAGLREAVVIGVRDEGGQWNSSTPSATIEVQVVGRTREWVEQEQALALDRVVEIAEAEQVSAGVDEDERIDAHVEPLTRAVDRIEPSGLARGAAVAAMLVAFSIVGGGIARVVGVSRPRRRGRPAERETKETTNTGVAS